MYQAIMTTYHGPTNTRGSRVSAKASAGRVSCHWDNALNVAKNHCAAARALAEKFEWSGLWVGGGMERGDVFVNLPGTYSRAWVDKYIPGIEGEDWFFIAQRSR